MKMIKKYESRRRMNEDYRYYYKELMSNLPLDEDYSITMQVGSSKSLNLNSQSVKALVDFFENEVKGKVAWWK